jgi:translation initiation factor IF-2
LKLLQEEADAPETLEMRAPIVTIMGHVDHGKTSLLDYIRRAKVAAGEAGGITQHIGAYSVKQEDGRRITFLDTPGHEAFTAMRARGAKVTDVAIIVIAADDAVMPQTEEAINHAMVAGVPIVFAFSKVDKPGANTDRVREQLAARNILVEEWGGKYQSQEISSKSGMGVNELLEKVLLEAELLELKANPNKRAVGTVVEASLDKGRGYVANILVQAGTLRVGDMMLAGAHYGRVKAMFDYRGKKLKEAGPAIPVQVLGLSGAPAAGDKLNVMENERDAREIANKREQIIREQSLRTRKHITLEEIGRRKAIGTFKELNVIVKGDVDGSVEALSDSLLKLSTEEVQVRIIHKGVGQVSESDVLLASAADAVIVAFQVRPSTNARRLAETEQIEIRTYSVIYQAIDEIRDAMEGLLAPTFEESVTANIEVRDVFKISKVGTVAGCYVLEGNVKRNNKIRVVRDFVVVHEGEISALKRYKDDVAEVKFGYECGLSIKNFNDIQEGDIIECYEMKEVKRTL